MRALIGGNFRTEFDTGRIIGRFTNNADAPPPAAGPAEVDDDWSF